MTKYIAQKTLIILLIWSSTIGGLTAQVVWPIQDGSHNMFTGFGDGYDGNVWGFHEGIDIIGSGKTVVAARAGTIILKNSVANEGTLILDVGGGQYDSYLHVENLLAKNKGDMVASGEVLGTIAAGHHPPGYEHLHFHVLNYLDTVATISGVRADGSNLLNPFNIFTSNADRDPGGHKPQLKDNNGDGELILFHNQADNSIGGLNCSYLWRSRYFGRCFG